MYDSEADTAPQLNTVLDVLRMRRGQLEQRLEGVREMLGEIGQHVQRCRRLLGGMAPADHG